MSAAGLTWWAGLRLNRRLGLEPSPAIASYRFRALKVSPGYKHHGIVTKELKSNDGCDA
jgi:hypothetical protein